MGGKGDSKLCLWLKLSYAAVHKLTLPGPDEDVRDADNREVVHLSLSYQIGTL